MGDEAAIRNSWTKAATRRARAFPAEQKERFVSAVPDALLESIRTKSDADWISLDDTLVVLDGLMEAFQDERAYVDFWRELIYDSYAGGLFSSLIQKAASWTGDNKRLLKLAPQAWSISTRNCGSVAVTRNDDGRMTLRSVDFPDRVAASRSFALLFEGAVLGMLGFVGGEGEVTFSTQTRDDGSIAGIGFDIV